MDRISESSNEGAILELFARQNKDFFFLEDKESAHYPLDSSYKSVTPFIKERRITVPTSEPHFGGDFEIEIEPFGDILIECNLLIQLPTWLVESPLILGGDDYPPHIVNNYYHIKTPGSDNVVDGTITGTVLTPTTIKELVNINGTLTQVDVSGNIVTNTISPDNGISYGYVNFPGYFLFSEIQFYQDNILIQKWSGDSLFLTQSTEGSWGSCFLDQTYLGLTESNARNIALRATPGYGKNGTLRLKIPLPGLQHSGDGGFPLCALPNHKFRFKIFLRNIEDLVVSSDNQMKPKPWDVPVFVYNDISGNRHEIVPLRLQDLKHPHIELETTQVYLAPETRERIVNMPYIQIPFRRHFENIYTIGPADYVPVMEGDTAFYKCRLEARNIAERIVFAFRSQNSILRNDLSNLNNPSGINHCDIYKEGKGQFYQNVALYIAGVEREKSWEPFLYQELNGLYKDERDSGYNIGEMRWNLGTIWSRSLTEGRQPEGGINFSTASRPTLYFELSKVPEYVDCGGRNTQLIVVVESWTIYKIQNGRGFILFPN